MRVLIAPDKFRGTFTAAEVCERLGRGLLEGSPDLVVDSVPLADGGEGTMEAVLRARGGTRVAVRARGPLGAEIDAEYGLTRDGTAVIEAARFCGLQLVPVDQRDPMRATSRGLGEAIASALDAGVRRFLIGLGGTATVDGGSGMAAALGYRFEDKAGRMVKPDGAALRAAVRLDASMAHPAIGASGFTALCDVDNPLLGSKGAAAVFGPQKGATAENVRQLESGLAALARVVAGWMKVDPAELARRPMGGAAGGLGMGCAAFLGAGLTSGAFFLMRLLGVAEKVAAADLVITGEGSFDSQTRGGKAVAAVLKEAARHGKRAIVVAGRWDGSLPEHRPGSMEIITAQSIGESSGRLTAEGLLELGRRIARAGDDLAKPPGG